MFPIDLSHGSPPIRRIKHHTNLIPKTPLPNRVAYRCNLIETKELQKQEDELITGNFVRESISPCLVLAWLVPKKDGTYRMCVNSKTINNTTIKYRYYIPQLDDILDKFHSVSIFSKIDLRNGYHQFQMREGDEWKMTLKTKGGLYEG